MQPPTQVRKIPARFRTIKRRKHESAKEEDSVDTDFEVVDESDDKSESNKFSQIN